MALGAPQPKISDALRALRERYRESSVAIIATLESTARALADDPTSTEAIERATESLHSIAGTAGSYGYADASELARVLEKRVGAWADDPALDAAQRDTLIDHFASAFRLCMSHDQPFGRHVTSRRRILAVDVPAAQVRALRSGAALRGYQLSTAVAAELSASSLRELAPHVILAPSVVVAPMLALGTVTNVPVIVLRRPDESPVVPASGDAVGAVHVLTGDMGTLFDLVDRLCLGSSWIGASVLVLDDDPSILSVVRHLLEEEGIRASTCGDPDQLLARIGTESPSMLLIDYRLGDISGIDVAHQVRSLPSCAQLPILLLARTIDDSTRELAARVGIEDVVSKPIVASDLLERIAAPLERQRLERMALGRHPGTGIPLTARTVANAEAMLGRLGEVSADAAEQGDGASGTSRIATAVLIRPDVAELTGEAATEWLRESERLAHALSTEHGVVGYIDGVALFALVEGETDMVEPLMQALLEGASVPWRAALADSRAVRPELRALRRATEDVMELMPANGGSPVITWRREEVCRAPDAIIVEDDASLAEMLQYVLRLTDLSTRRYASAEDAMDALNTFETGDVRPLLLLDVMLPGMDGHELHAKLRAARGDDYAVVFISARDDDEGRMQALREGALDYVTKPVTYRALMSKVPLWRAWAQMRRSASASA
jgi:DNA-binding response OmpR family regulator/HPt (histidine-containing phosphotransfer) domain-containing protein